MNRFICRVVSWSLGTSMEVLLVLEALNRALGQRRLNLTSC